MSIYFNFQWKEAEIPKSDEIKAKITGVEIDQNLKIYGQTNEQRSEADFLRDVIQAKYNRTCAPLNKTWKKDEMCVARDRADGLFYRGEILDTNQKDALVHFIDEGVTKWINIQDLRYEIVFQNTQRQCYRWQTTSDIQMIHIYKEELKECLERTVLGKEYSIKISCENEEYKVKEVKINVQKELFYHLQELGYLRILPKEEEAIWKRFLNVVFKKPRIFWILGTLLILTLSLHIYHLTEDGEVLINIAKDSLSPILPSEAKLEKIGTNVFGTLRKKVVELQRLFGFNSWK